ncbi:MAG: DUF4260 family protein [Candidatus Limnocylindrales bacterium]
MRPLLRAEGFALGVAGLVGYGQLGGDWLWLVPLLLLPDLSIAGYAAGPVVGALVYDLVHNLVLGLVLAGVGLWAGIPALAILGSVLVAHVGFDRLAGYGLKHPSGFKDTHMQRA